MAPAWAAGLTVTTTGLNQQDKQAVKNDVEAAGGRYSPNLSKRTTHLVTPTVVGALSDKLAAAAAAGSRFDTHIVSLDWVAASAASRGRVAEVQYAPVLPEQTPAAHILPAALTAQPGSSSSSTRQARHAEVASAAAAETPGATAAPQTPWVVHFSQMVDDSIYGMPEHPSPTAHQRLAEQLQEQQYQEQQQQQLLQAIEEEQSQDVSPAPVRPPLQSSASFAPGVLSVAAAAAAHSNRGQQEATGSRLQRQAAAAAGSLTLHAQGTPQLRPHPLQLPGAGPVPGSSSETTALAAAAAAQHKAATTAVGCGQQVASISKGDRSRAAFGSMLASPATVEAQQVTPVQQLARISPPQPTFQLQTQAQQQGQKMLQQQQQQPTLPVESGGCGSVDELISALRRVTTGGRRSTSDLIASPVQAVALAAAAAAAELGPGQRSPLLPQQDGQRWQQSPAAGRGVIAAGVKAVPSFGINQQANSTVDELIGALQRVTDSRKSTAEAAPGAAEARMHLPVELQQQQQQQAGPADSSLFGSLSNVDDLIVALRRATSDNARKATAEGTPQGSQNPVTPPTQQQQRGRWPWEQAPATPLHQQQQQQQQALPPGSAAGVGAPAAAAAASSVEELILALRRATGDSRRSTAEAAPSSPRWEPQQFWMGQQQQRSTQPGGLQDGSLYGSLSSVDDLLGALRRATGDSRRGTAESAPDAPASAADTSAAAAAEVAVGKLKAAWIGQDPGASAASAAGAAGASASLYGSLSSVDDLLGALRRATGDSRRGTAESAPDAPAGSTDTPAAAAAEGDAGKQSRVGQGLSGAAAAAAAEPAGLFGSMNSVDDLIQALRSATDGRRDTGEAAKDGGEAPAAAAVQNWQQHEAEENAMQRALAASDSVRRQSMGSCSNFEDLLASLLRATASSSRRGTAEAAAVPLESQSSQQQQQQEEEEVQWQPAVTPGSKRPSNAGCSPAYMSGGSISQLVNSLRRATAETHGKLKAAAEAVTPASQQPPVMQAAGTPAAGNPVADTPAAPGASRADMQELVAALRRVTGDGQVRGCSSAGADSTPIRLLATPLDTDQAPSGVQDGHQEQQQQQHHVLIQQLLLHTQEVTQDEQLPWQQHGSSDGYLKAAWGSTGGGEEATPAASAAAAAAAAPASSSGLEQLLAALQGAASSEAWAATDVSRGAATAAPAQHAARNTEFARGSATELEQLLKGAQQQQEQKQQQAELVTNQEDPTPDRSSSLSPHAPVAALNNLPADHQAHMQQQLQQQLEVAEVLDPSQSPLRARQLWHDEAAPVSAEEECMQPQLSLSQLVHALQNTGGQQASTGGAAPSSAAAGTAAPAAAGIAAAGAAVEDCRSTQNMSNVTTVAAAAATAAHDRLGSADLYRFPTSTPSGEPLQAGAELPLKQAPATRLPAHAEAIADTAAATAGTAAEPGYQLQQQQSPLPAEAAAQADSPAEQQQASAASGLQLCSCSSMAVAFDPHIPAEIRQELAVAVAAAGGCVVAGQPHLGCGANTVVAEPQHAAQWLQLLMHSVSPAWLHKACRQQQQQQQGCMAQQQLMCLSPDVARALGQSTQQPGQQSGLQQHRDAAAAAVADSIRYADSTSSLSSTLTTTDAAQCNASSSTAAQAAEMAAGDSTRNNSSGVKACRSVLAVPGGVSVDGGMGLCMAAAGGTGQQQQQQPLLMPPGLLEGVDWSVDQDPRSVGDEELEAVILQGGTSSITLLLPQDSSGLLGHAPLLVSACQPCKGLTCSDILQAIHSFYQQEVLLQQQQQSQQQHLASSTGSATASGAKASSIEGSTGSAVDVQEQQQRQQQQGRGEGGVVVRRLQLMGARLLLEGLVRATRDPCSCVYEVCLA